MLEFLKRELNRGRGDAKDAKAIADFDAVGDAASELESVAVPLGDGKPAPGAPLDDAGAAHDNPAMDEEYKSQLEAEERRYKRLEENLESSTA